MPELEELQAADDNQRRISVQGMVDRIEGQSHGQPVAKRPAVPHGHTPDKDVADLEEASKVMAEGIMVYVKAVVSHITQSTNQRNFQHKEPKQGVGSSGACETHRSIPTPPILEEKYTSPHRREETVFQRGPANVRGNENGNTRAHLHQLYNVTNPVNQPDLCEEGMSFPVESTDINADNGAYEARGARFYNHPLQNRNTGIINLDLVRETVQELYGPALRLIGRPEFHKSYPEMIDHNNPYPRGYKIPDFSLFIGEDGQSAVEHVARFTIKCGTLANLENFSRLKIRIKKMKNRCKVFLPEGEFVKMAQKGLDFELRKKLQGMEFRDFFELCSKVTEYEELLKEESYKKKTTLGSYYQDIEEVALAETISPAHRVPFKEEIKKREYCEYHDPYNYTTKSCFALKDILREIINRGVLKSPEKQNSMVVDKDPFPPVAAINMNMTDLKEFLNTKQERRVMNKKMVRAYWIPKGQMFEAHKKYGGSTTKHVSWGSRGNVGGSTANWPRNQHFPNKMRESHHSNYMNRQTQREIQKEKNYRPRLLPTNTHKERDCLKKYEPNGKARGASVAEHHNRPRFVLPPSNEIDDMWKVARHKKFPKALTRTQKRRVLREKAAAKRELEGTIISKSKCCRKATEDKNGKDSEDSSSEEDTQRSRTIDFYVGKFHISVDCNTCVVILPEKFKLCSEHLQRTESHGSEKQEKKKIENVEDSSGVIIKGEHASKPKQVIIEKPTPEMTKHIRPLYIKAHLNGKPVSRVLIDNGSAINVLPLRMLRNLGKSEEDLKVSVSAFTGESTKTIGVLPANVTVGSLSSLCAFFVVNSFANFQALLGRDWIHANQCIPSSMHQPLLFWKGDEVEIVEAGTQPFQANTSTVEARYYSGDFGPIKVRNANAKDVKTIYMESSTPSPILDKILKPTVIVPYRLVIQPMTEEIDD
ncbi:hypothetical protein F511_27563 [Dorcoceras hygrometricum]|uniref:Retrotransposon gag domain-containing protein n=1 Tax=Dorcoceras hygrometricum TaxID=472368 RepID=A0A2Z7D399_9LAMI|nr:hypothetical protein F511_27563 [Dorcoceras hygrometricum]